MNEKRWTSNTKDVFRAAVGQRIVGFYEDGTRFCGRIYVLVLEDGTGIAFGTGNGSHWTVSALDVKMATGRIRDELERTQAALRDVLSAAGQS